MQEKLVENNSMIPNLQKQLSLNSLRSRRNKRHFAGDIFKCIFLNENDLILIKITLKFIPKGRINNIPALLQIMARRRPGDKPLSEPMMILLLMHIYVTQPQWVKSMILKVDHYTGGKRVFIHATKHILFFSEIDMIDNREHNSGH